MNKLEIINFLEEENRLLKLQGFVPTLDMLLEKLRSELVAHEGEPQEHEDEEKVDK